MTRFFKIFTASVLVAWSAFGFCGGVARAENAKEAKSVYDAIAGSQADDDKYEWTSLFDGQTLKYWIDLKDAGDNVVKAENGDLVLGMGPTTTSIRFDEEGAGFKFPCENYELEYVARRASGSDFFAAATVPIGENFATFVNGGWGGFVAGISNVDGMDASENSTSSFYNFKTNQWYRFRIQVTKRVLRVWVNDEKIIDYVIEGHSLKTRFEVSRCQPLGFASWVSEGDIKVVRFRMLSDEELKEMNAKADATPAPFSWGK